MKETTFVLPNNLPINFFDHLYKNFKLATEILYIGKYYVTVNLIKED